MTKIKATEKSVISLPHWLDNAIDDSLLRIEDICSLYNVKQSTVERWIKDGEYPKYHMKRKGITSLQTRYWKAKVVKDFYLQQKREQSVLDSVLFVRDLREDLKRETIYPDFYVLDVLGTNETVSELVKNGKVLLPDFYEYNHKKQKVYCWVEKNFEKSVRMFRNEPEPELKYADAIFELESLKELAIVEEPEVSHVVINNYDDKMQEMFDVVSKIKKLAEENNLIVKLSFEVGKIQTDLDDNYEQSNANDTARMETMLQ